MAVKTLDPTGVQYRLNDLQRHRGEDIVPGPNFIWSIDGHCKLEMFGIEIFAAIDAYSRYIVWIYVGISARTSISVLRQYLDAVTELQVIPKIIRSDRGGETPLCATAHHQLRQNSSYEVTLDECYYYGTSTANQRIEAWWMQLTGRALYKWRVR